MTMDRPSKPRHNLPMNKEQEKAHCTFARDRLFMFLERELVEGRLLTAGENEWFTVEKLLRAKARLPKPL